MVFERRLLIKEKTKETNTGKKKQKKETQERNKKGYNPFQIAIILAVVAEQSKATSNLSTDCSHQMTQV